MPAGLKRYWAKHRKGGSKKHHSRGRSMARAYHKPKVTIPLAIVAGFAPTVVRAVQDSNSFKNPGNFFKRITYNFTGINMWANNKFEMAGIKAGWLPLGVGLLAHVLATKLGINRALARSGIPFVRI
jgi:hypothetical protein